nr:hypothetical protein [Tanacetum cinerariifolium]
MVLGIAPEMAQPVQNINYSAFRSMFEREKLFGINFNDWFRQLKLVLRIKKKMYVIERPLLVAPAADSEANDLKSMFEKQVGVEMFDLIQTFYACKQEEGFVRNYNMHNMGKTIGELHVMLIEYKKGLPKKAKTPQLTPSYTPQHNGVFERINRTLFDMVRSMMNLTTLPLSFWNYALESAIRILNMVPTKKVDKTPYVLWYGKVLNLSYLKVWGCEAPVKRDTPNKLQQRSVKCIFIGYTKETMEVSGRAVNLEEIQDEDTSPFEITSEIPMEVKGFEPPQEEVILIRRSERTHRAPNCLCLNIEMEKHSLGDLNEPTSYKAAMLDSESNKWIDAMNAEIQPMIDNMVWVLVDLSLNCKTVESKWIFKKKTDMDEIRAIKILISLAAYYDYEIWQIDVKTTFSNGYLDEDIYMVQPDCFVDPNHPKKACKLQRSIYGLKQASRSWNKRFDEEIKNLQSAKDYLRKYFAMKDLEEAAFILGIKICKDRSKRLIGLGQNAYVDKILKRYKMDNSKSGHIPMQERIDLNKTQGASTPKE